MEETLCTEGESDIVSHTHPSIHFDITAVEESFEDQGRVHTFYSKWVLGGGWGGGRVGGGGERAAPPSLPEAVIEWRRAAPLNSFL